MPRIFISLSLLPAALVMATMGLGWWVGDYNGVFAEVTEVLREETGPPLSAEALAALERLDGPQGRFTTHFQFGVASALAVVLINCLSVTYLIGTSRWVKEVSEAYGLDTRFHAEVTVLKRRTFPYSIAGVTAVVAIVALGAASDPGTTMLGTARFVKPHMLTAIMGSVVILYAILVQAKNLQGNAQVIGQVVDEVHRERLARGLPVESS